MSAAHTLIIQFDTWLMERPVAWQSCFFSSSLGYGWSACRCSQALRKSVVSLGSLPRLRVGCTVTAGGVDRCVAPAEAEGGVADKRES